MRNKLIASAVPVLFAVTMVAATQSHAVAGQPKDQAIEARLHGLHTKRPSAVSKSKAVSRAVANGYLAAYVNTVNAAQTQQYLTGMADADAYLHALESARHHATRPTRRSSGGAAPSNGGGGDFLACTRNRESHGNYGAVSSGGTYRGAYQFLPHTWNTTAAAAGRGDLVGQDPAAASPADQDAMAASLHASQGTSPWGGRCG